ncbi:MAG: DUF6261 family protein [Tannerellaceae bacterium]|nr:DUF6261 family protein [Tannerellaceae bacterium]
MKISKFIARNLRNEEWFRFHTEFSALVTLCGTDLLNLMRLYPPYETRYKEAYPLFDMQPHSFIRTDAIDRHRSAVFLGLQDTARALLKTSHPEQQLATVKVYNAINQYNNAVRRATLAAAKTAAIDSLLQDLASDRLSREVRLLELDEWIEDLDAANKAYKQSPAEQVEDAAARPSSEHLSQIRAEMDRDYANMIHVINARLLTVKEEASPEEEAEGKILRFGKALNDCIARYKSLLKGRRMRSAKKEKEGQDDFSEDF